MPERTPRYTPEQRRAMGEARRRRAALGRYGYDPGEMGQAARNRAALKLRYGASFPLSYLTDWRNGELWLRPTARQTGRLESGNWQPGEWRPASQVLGSRHYAAIQRQNDPNGLGGQRSAWAASHPGGSYYDWLGYRFAQGLPQVGNNLRQLRSGEYRDNEGRPVTGPATPPVNPLGSATVAPPAVAQSAGTLGSLPDYSGLTDEDGQDFWRRRRGAL